VYTCRVCLSEWPTPEEAARCEDGPHRRCPVCGRWDSADSRYCEYDGAALVAEDDDAFQTESRCWPLPLPHGLVGWACGSQPPSEEDMAVIMEYVNTVVLRHSHEPDEPADGYRDKASANRARSKRSM